MPWTAISYMSGTRVVVDDAAPDSPHYYIHAGDAREGYRDDVSGDLAAWLNGGPDPVWRRTLRRTGEEYCDGMAKIHISATGPMRLPPNDAGAMRWQTEERDRPSRIALIDRLMRASS